MHTGCLLLLMLHVGMELTANWRFTGVGSEPGTEMQMVLVVFHVDDVVYYLITSRKAIADLFVNRWNNYDAVSLSADEYIR